MVNLPALITHSDTSNDLNFLIENLEKELVSVTEAYEGLVSMVDESLKELDEYPAYLTARLRFEELVSRIAELGKTKAEHVHSSSVEDDSFEDAEETVYESETPAKPKKKERAISQTSETKRLFRRIANLVHPDKSKLPNAAELFKTACIMYKHNDTHGLSKLYRNIVAGKATGVISEEELLVIIESLKQKLAGMSVAMEDFISTPKYNMFLEKRRSPNLTVASNRIANILNRTYHALLAQYFPTESFSSRYNTSTTYKTYTSF